MFSITLAEHFYAVLTILARDSIYAKRAYAIAIPSVGLSVCLSVRPLHG